MRLETDYDEATDALLRRDSLQLREVDSLDKLDLEQQTSVSASESLFKRAGRLIVEKAVWLAVVGVLVTVAAYPFFSSSRPYTCPSPFRPSRQYIYTFNRSPFIPLPSRDDAFSLSISHDTSTCNAFTLRIRRFDQAKCAEMERGPDPAPEDKSTSRWIRGSVGPDMFSVVVEGAERRLADVPSRYARGCEYSFESVLSNAGRVWLSAEWLYEDYNGFREKENNDERPRINLLKRPLLDPVELDICAPICSPYIPPSPHSNPSPLSVSDFSPDAPHHNVDVLARLPDCSAIRSQIRGSYLMNSPYTLIHPPAPLVPLGTAGEHLADLRLSPGGLHTFVPSSCTFSPAVQRWGNHSSCTEKPFKALFIGDSHARASFDTIGWRMQGNTDTLLESAKMEDKEIIVGGLELTFKWNQWLDASRDCETFGRYNAIVISVGTHLAAYRCTTTQHYLEHMSSIFNDLPAVLRRCPSFTGTLPKLVVLTQPTSPPRLSESDCRSGPRLQHWNDGLTQLARKQGDWEVVDVFEYTRPIQADLSLYDSTHFLRTDAADPIADEIILRLGMCGTGR